MKRPGERVWSTVRSRTWRRWIGQQTTVPENIELGLKSGGGDGSGAPCRRPLTVHGCFCTTTKLEGPAMPAACLAASAGSMQGPERGPAAPAGATSFLYVLRLTLCLPTALNTLRSFATLTCTLKRCYRAVLSSRLATKPQTRVAMEFRLLATARATHSNELDRQRLRATT